MTTKGGQWIKSHFTGDDEAKILEAIATESSLPACPRCGEKLTCNLPSGGRCSRHDVWVLECETCLQCIVIEDEFGGLHKRSPS